MRHDDDDGRHNNGKGQHGDMQQDELSVRGPLVFPYFFRSSNFKYPARTKKKRKNWREIHPLDPLAKWSGQAQRRRHMANYYD
jgi:hypothetical protein